MKTVATTQLRLALEAKDEKSAKKIEWIEFGFDLDLIWIEIGVFKSFKECARSPCNGNHFSSILCACICRGSKSVDGITWAKHAHVKSVLGGKIRPVLPVLFISTIRWICFSMGGRETFT